MEIFTFRKSKFLCKTMPSLFFNLLSKLRVSYLYIPSVLLLVVLVDTRVRRKSANYKGKRKRHNNVGCFNIVY